MKPLAFTWKFNEVPHAVIDINRNCNISCFNCYNTRSTQEKSFAQVKQELEQLIKRRTLDTVSIVGGEPTLHPDIFKIIRLIKEKRLSAALITNALVIDQAYAKKLKQAGLNLVFLHIDIKQKRPDLSKKPSYQEIKILWDKKARILASCGIDTGVQVILCKSELSELDGLIEFIVNSPVIHYLFITNFTDFSKFTDVQGNLYSGLRVSQQEAIYPVGSQEEITIEDIKRVLLPKNMHPFAYLGSNLDPKKARWLIYKMAVLNGAKGKNIRHRLTSSIGERVLIKLTRLIKGRYVYYRQPAAWPFKIQILLNAFSGGKIFGNLVFLLRSLSRERSLYEKHVLIQQGPTVTGKGIIEHCRNCPDAAIRDGELVPVCLSDRLSFKEVKGYAKR